MGNSISKLVDLAFNVEPLLACARATSPQLLSQVKSTVKSKLSRAKGNLPCKILHNNSTHRIIGHLAHSPAKYAEITIDWELFGAEEMVTYFVRNVDTLQYCQEILLRVKGKLDDQVFINLTKDFLLGLNKSIYDTVLELDNIFSVDSALSVYIFDFINI